MRLLLILLTLSSLAYSNEVYFRSNSSGIILEEIDKAELSDYEYYIIREEQENKILDTLINEGALVWSEAKFYNEGNSYPYRREKIDGNKREVEDYKSSGETLIVTTFQDGTLKYRDLFSYDESGLLKDITRESDDNEVIYKDLFFRGNNGELRVVTREHRENNFINRWFYNNGAIVESWYIDDISSIRTKYSVLGDIISVINYSGEDIIYSEEYTYNKERILQSVIKTTEDSTQERYYNSDGLVTQLKIKESDILVKKHLYRYSGDTLISEKITGHGLVEEYIYTLDSEGEVILISYYVNKELKSNIIKESEDREIKEFFKDGSLFLREYFRDKEKIERELYIDGVLFKREIFSE